MQRCAATLTFVDGRVDDEPGASEALAVTAVAMQRDLARLVKRRVVQRRVVMPTDVLALPPVEVPAQYVERRSPSGALLAVVREAKGNAGDELQVFRGDVLLHAVDLAPHGAVYFDEYFASFAWAPDERRFALIVEPKAPERTRRDDGIGPLPDFAHRPGYGEAYGSKHRPCVCIVTLPDESAAAPTVVVLAHVPGVAQVAFTADAQLLVFARLLGAPLGVVYCFNRRSGVYIADLAMHRVVPLVEDVGSARSLRLHPDGRSVVFLHNATSDPHNSIATLAEVTLPRGDAPPAYRTVTRLYAESLPQRCWLRAGEGYRVACTSSSRARQVLTLVNLRSGTTVTFEPETAGLNDATALSVLDVLGDRVLASASSPRRPPALVLVRASAVAPENGHEGWIWSARVLSAPAALDVAWSLLHTPAVPDANAFLLHPVRTREASRLPLVVMPHGGPHAMSALEFSYQGAVLALSGYACLFINYRGSTGFDDATLRSLLGRIGSQDVDDVHSFVLAALQANASLLDPNRVVLYGGSHGGFLTAHLLAKHPTFYKAGALRNPVVDVAAMLSVTDIPDWTFAETGLAVTDPALPSAATYSALLSVSPIAHAHRITSPVLLLLGTDDRRVPPSQGLLLLSCLRHNSPRVRLYDGEGHPLSGVEAETDVVLSVLSFFDSVL